MENHTSTASGHLAFRNPLQIVRAVVFALVLREMRTRFGARRMGAFWVFFEPIVHVTALAVVYTAIRGHELRGMEYPVFVVTGILPFLMMRNIALFLMEGVAANQALFAYQQIKPFDTFIARTIVEFSLFICVYLLMMLGMGLWFGLTITMNDPLLWLVSLAEGIAIAFGLGVILCVCVQAAPGIRTFVRLMFMPLYFLSGVIFPVWKVPPQYFPLVSWNPFLHVIDGLRTAIFDYYPHTDGIDHAYPMRAAIVILFVGMCLYHLRKKRLLAQ